jgi:hypothetical protein
MLEGVGGLLQKQLSFNWQSNAVSMPMDIDG